MSFVDTGAWYATFVRNDPGHQSANLWLDSNHDTLVTTDYVLDELLTLLLVRGERDRAITVGKHLFAGEAVQLEWVLPEDVRRAWFVFIRYLDKGWSFTDCVSYTVMHRLGIQTAFAFDDHFRQFGSVTVVPEPSN